MIRPILFRRPGPPPAPGRRVRRCHRPGGGTGRPSVDGEPLL